jgi:hypothetical protein
VGKQCLTSILKSIGIWISKHRENGAAVLNASTNKTIVLGTHADADEPEPNDDDKAMLQADEFGIVKSNEVTLETAVREVLFHEIHFSALSELGFLGKPKL